MDTSCSPPTVVAGGGNRGECSVKNGAERGEAEIGGDPILAGDRERDSRTEPVGEVSGELGDDRWAYSGVSSLT